MLGKHDRSMRDAMSDEAIGLRRLQARKNRRG